MESQSVSKNSFDPSIIRNRISCFPQFSDLVIKGSGVDALFPAPLIIEKSALAAFHDKFNLFRFSYTVRIHNDCSLKIK